MRDRTPVYDTDGNQTQAHLIEMTFVLVSFDVEVFVDTFDLDVFSVCLI